MELINKIQQVLHTNTNNNIVSQVEKMMTAVMSTEKTMAPKLQYAGLSSNYTVMQHLLAGMR